MALGGRVGVGNIAAVATAIFYGGPGALFWMWVYALLGAASAFAESTAGQIWKTEDNGEYCGGPAQYIARGLRCKPLAILYALAAVVAFGLTGPTVQSYNIADSVRNAFHIPPLVTGIVIAILFAIIVAGGAKRIGSFASYVVPFMAGVYIVLMVIMTIYGSANSSALVWNIADVGVGLIAWFNLLGLLFLVKPVAALLKDFEKQKKLGLDPVFVPEDCGIKNAELWHEITNEHYSDLIAEKNRVMGAAESRKD